MDRDEHFAYRYWDVACSLNRACEADDRNNQDDSSDDLRYDWVANGLCHIVQNKVDAVLLVSGPC